MSAPSSLWQRTRRYLRHRWLEDQVLRSVGVQTMEQLTAAIAQAEQQHTGQIRLCIEGGLPASYLRRNASARERAVMLFGKLQVWDTEHNNGVLIYLLLADRSVEIVADRGVARRVPDEDWSAIVQDMQGALRAGDYSAALTLAISQVSKKLEVHDDVARETSNELPDEPAIGPFRY